MNVFMLLFGFLYSSSCSVKSSYEIQVDYANEALVEFGCRCRTAQHEYGETLYHFGPWIHSPWYLQDGAEKDDTILQAEPQHISISAYHP